MDVKKNISLWFAIAIPILMIIFVAAAVYIPSAYVKPEGKFVYIDQDANRFNSKFEYLVKNGRLERTEVEFSEAEKPVRLAEPRIFIYDIATDERRELEFSEAQRLNLTDKLRSDQGFEIVQGRGGGEPFGGGSDFGSIFVKKGAFSKRLDLGGKRFYEINVIGWART